jgi:hypothetical protein
MKNKFDRITLALTALSTLSIAGCLAGEPTSDPASDPDQASAPATTDISARIQAAAAAASSYHQLVNHAYNQCMDAPGGVLNVILKLSNCINTTASSSQKWAFVAAGPPSTFFLVNQLSGFCAEVNNGTSIPGERVDEWHCDGSSAEQWVQSFRVIDGIAYQVFTHAGTSLCLDTVGSAGSQLMQWNCSGNDAQTWLVR